MRHVLLVRPRFGSLPLSCRVPTRKRLHVDLGSFPQPDRGLRDPSFHAQLGVHDEPSAHFTPDRGLSAHSRASFPAKMDTFGMVSDLGMICDGK